MNDNQLDSSICYPEKRYNQFGLREVWVIELPGCIVYSLDKDKCKFKAKKVWEMLQETNTIEFQP